MANNVVGDTNQSLNDEDISTLRHTWVLFTHINRMTPIVRNNTITQNNANMEALMNNVYTSLNTIIQALRTTINVVNKDDLSQLGINIQILINELTQMGRPLENYGQYDDLLATCNNVEQLLDRLGFIYDGVIDVPLFNGPPGPSDGPAPPAGVARVGLERGGGKWRRSRASRSFSIIFLAKQWRQPKEYGKKTHKLLRSSRSRRRKIRKRTRKSHKRHNKRSKRRHSIHLLRLPPSLRKEIHRSPSPSASGRSILR